ncbi:MAG TPA: hypothetical protein VKD91_11735, partial [Pyrinomonadaceae bacterium]|nr:hypothetical protein [Pyrinomonadaceae bacterium]
MFCSTHARAIFLLTALTVCFFGAGGAMAQDLARPQVSTQVQLRWGLRPGVSRYRLQVSHDR